MSFYIYTLGCKVNAYESSVMAANLKKAGFIELSKDECVDIYIINTCTVTNTAGNKSLKMLRQAYRKNNQALLIVVGCLSQVESVNISKFPNVGIILGNKNKSKIVDYIVEYQKNKKQIIDIYDLNKVDFECMKLDNVNQTRAFVKIQDGCNNFCSYCIIPYTRGDVRSKSHKDVLDEISSLVLSGHREIVLTGIHTGHYGSDLDNYDFADLLKEIVQITNLERLRISSIEITELDDKVLDIINSSKIIVDHLHIPLQSGCDKTLSDMNRKYNVSYFIDKVSKIRKIRPNISLTTDVIVGFPGETDFDFETTYHNIKRINFSKIHVFPYSVRKGTKAELMPNQISEVVKKERVKKLLELSKELEISYMQKFIGKEILFIPEVYHSSYLIGHTGNYLLIKALGDESLLNTDVPVIITEVSYPYCLASLKNKIS
ncbi:MAG: tRNA (N(6)-L-threonylcarbamoyladenosine(37)-C(2))-methylthiotransferase MtaB [Bacilli bacterium]|nr:tRNA (N(6)-L-threonylcarbamoyladenosine(37)-C(2))-methylthiotransferase MtaB [Bacilli bacterium]